MKYGAMMVVHFGWHPRQVDQLTVVEFESYAQALDSINKKKPGLIPGEVTIEGM